jgi:hypothetical protein
VSSASTNVALPKLTRSPAVTRLGLVTRQPFTLVPLVEPRSASSQPSGPRSKLACHRDTVWSASVISQASSRPMVKRCADPVGRRSDGGQPRSHSSADRTTRRHADAAAARSRLGRGRTSATSPYSSTFARARSACSTRWVNVSCVSRPAAKPSLRSASARSRSVSDARSTATPELSVGPRATGKFRPGNPPRGLLRTGRVSRASAGAPADRAPRRRCRRSGSR